MGRKKSVNFWACDFETTVWGEELEKVKGKQTEVEVWSAASVMLYDDNETVHIDGSIRDFLTRFIRSKENNILYFHNLSFDGSYITDFLLRNGYTHTNENDKYMENKTFKCCISKMGQWYYIKIRKGHTLLEIRDSYKLIPSSLELIGYSFQTKHRKLEMKYEGDRHAYCEITDEEKEYIKNDVLVLKEALEKMFDDNHTKLTIGSCCLAEFKDGFEKKEYEMFFPDLTEIPYKYNNAYDFARKSYHGGWCYVNPKFAHVIVKNGVVYDVNSLYPSVMHSISGNRYPVGKPTFFEGEPPKDLIDDGYKYYFIHFKCRFKLKPRCLPWVHIRNSALYKSNENLTTSDVRFNGKYSRYYIDQDGLIQDTITEMTLTCKDWELFNETYDIENLEIIDGCWYNTVIGIFDEYINYYKKLKITSEGFLREIAKLFLNNLYGKLAMSDDSSYKVPYLDEKTDSVKFLLIEEHEKKVGYIACGSAITSYAMNFTIRAAMDNYDRFCYADTDSIHLEGFEDAIGVVEHPNEFCMWKQEGKFDTAYYEGQKRYIENMVEKDHKAITPNLEIKCAGMSKSAKKQFIDMGYEIDQLNENLELENANLKATRVKGGILLRKKSFKLRKSIDKKVNICYN